MKLKNYLNKLMCKTLLERFSMALNLPKMVNIFKHSRETGEGFSKEKKTVKELLLFPNESSVSPSRYNHWAIVDLSATGHCNWNIKLPDDFTAIETLSIVVIPDDTEDITGDVDASIAKVGQNFENTTVQLAAVGDSVVENVLHEIDISRIITGGLTQLASAGDYLGIWFNSNTSNWRIIGLKFKYT